MFLYKVSLCSHEGHLDMPALLEAPYKLKILNGFGDLTGDGTYFI